MILQRPSLPFFQDDARRSEPADETPSLKKPPRGRWLIVTGDDLGHSSEVNRAILSAHRDGILTSASLMVNGAAFEEGVDLARATPSLAVGLHLGLSLSKSTLPPGDIPALVDREGNFSPNPTLAGWNYFISRKAQVQLEREIRAQFDKFLSTGLPIDHVDGHQHLHLHPTVFPILVRISSEYRVPAIRVIRENLPLHLRIDFTRLVATFAATLAFSLLERWAVQTLCASPLRRADWVLGLLADGRMGTAHLRRLLPALPSGVTEIYSHPALDGPNAACPGSRQEYEALIDPHLRETLDGLGIRRTSYSNLCRGPSSL
jgi:hopanoid biosynthesis associated protein HpnK